MNWFNLLPETLFLWNEQRESKKILDSDRNVLTLVLISHHDTNGCYATLCRIFVNCLADIIIIFRAYQSLKTMGYGLLHGRNFRGASEYHELQIW